MILYYSINLETTAWLVKNSNHSETVLIISDAASKLYLDDIKYKYIYEWDYISTSELVDNWKRSHDIEYRKIVNDFLLYKYGDLYNDACKQDFIYVIQQAINSKLVYSRILHSFSIEEIIFVSNSEFLPIVRTGPKPVDQHLKGVSTSIFKYLLDSNGIIFRDEKISTSTIRIKCQAHRIFSLIYWGILYKKFNRFIKKSIQNISKFIIRKKISVLDSKTCNDSSYLILSEDFLRPNEFSRISNTFNNNVKTINLSSIRGNNREEFSFEFRNFIKGTDFIEYNFLYANKYLLPQLISIAYECDLINSFIQKNNRTLTANINSVFVFGYDAFARERVFIRYLKSKLISSVSLLHTGVMPLMATRGLIGESDNLIVWNEDDINSLNLYHQNELTENIHVIGSLEFEGSAPYLTSKFSSNIISNLKKITGRKNILILTAFTNIDFVGTLMHGSDHNQSLTNLFDFMRDNSDFNFILKPHPSFDFYSAYRFLIEKYKLSNLEYYESTRLSDILNLVDVAIMYNYPGSSFLESTLHDLPVIYFKSKYLIPDFDEVNTSYEIFSVDNFSSLNSSIRAIFDDQVYRSIVVDQNLCCVQSILNISKKSSPSTALIKIVDSLKNK